MSKNYLKSSDIPLNKINIIFSTYNKYKDILSYTILTKPPICHFSQKSFYKIVFVKICHQHHSAFYLTKELLIEQQYGTHLQLRITVRNFKTIFKRFFRNILREYLINLRDSP